MEDNTLAENEGVNIVNCVFRNNTASSVNGGAIHYDGSNGLNTNQETLYIANSTFFGNNASSGGALCAWGVALTQLEGCVFDHNTAYYGRGGGLYAYGEPVFRSNALSSTPASTLMSAMGACSFFFCTWLLMKQLCTSP